FNGIGSLEIRGITDAADKEAPGNLIAICQSRWGICFAYSRHWLRAGADGQSPRASVGCLSGGAAFRPIKTQAGAAGRGGAVGAAARPGVHHALSRQLAAALRQ